MKILITCIHYPVASGRYIADAFRRLGHDVKTSGPSTGRDIWGGQVDEKYVWLPSEFTAHWLPDLIINCDSAYAPAVNFHPLVLWGVDNHVRDYQHGQWDEMFLAHSWGYGMEQPNAHWLPCAYDPTQHTNLKVERDIDVAFIGVMYSQRHELCKAFANSGLNVVFGTGPIYEEYNAIYNRAKIALVQSIEGDLAQRFFENMAQGCCVLADQTVDAHLLGFKAGAHYWAYNSNEDAVAAAQYLIDSGLYQDVANVGREKVEPHTWDNRARELLKIMGMSQ